MLGRVVFVNGPPASGKTTVARAFQALRHQRRDETWLLVQLDTFSAMAPHGVALSDEQRDACVTVMTDALTTLLAGPLDVLVELVVRDDDAVRAIARDLRAAAEDAGREETWLTLRASERVRDERNRARGSTSSIEVHARLDEDFVGLGEVVDTEALDAGMCASHLSALLDQA